MARKNFCTSCEQSNFEHFNSWIDELSRHLLPSLKLPTKLLYVVDICIEKICTLSHIANFRKDFTKSTIQLRTFVFLEEMKKRGASCSVLYSFNGFTSHVKMEVNGNIFRFEGFPTAEFLSKYSIHVVDDKELAKEHCKKGNFPIADGKSFWFWQKAKALRFAQSIGYPLVVKPRGGSVSRHVTTNIQNEGQLKKAISHAIAYSPSFIVERFIANAFVTRATVIDFNFVVCVQQVPAHVVGDGGSTVRELIDRKNSLDNRDKKSPSHFILHTIVEDETTSSLLQACNLTFQSIPEKGKVVYLQKDPFLKLGGDLIEVTSDVHPDNIKLFSDLARHFDIRVTGIDFLVPNISLSWKDQPCAILELNSLPCIDLHHFPSSGNPTNPAKALADMFEKYYL